MWLGANPAVLAPPLSVEGCGYVKSAGGARSPLRLFVET
jgi:hypothetical protein